MGWSASRVHSQTFCNKKGCSASLVESVSKAKPIETGIDGEPLQRWCNQNRSEQQINELLIRCLRKLLVFCVTLFQYWLLLRQHFNIIFTSNRFLFISLAFRLLANRLNICSHFVHRLYWFFRSSFPTFLNSIALKNLLLFICIVSVNILRFTVNNWIDFDW